MSAEKRKTEQVMISGSREAAFYALLVSETRGAWSDQALSSASLKWNLDQRDTALAANLCYGVLQNQILLDFWIDQFSNRHASEMDVEVRVALRIGLYQLHFLDRIPANAAVNESVNLVRKYKNKGAAGLVNAVMRTFQRTNPCPQPPKNDLSTRYSHPVELVQLFSKELDGNIEPLLAANNSTTEMCIQVNTLKVTATELFQILRHEGVDAQYHPWLENCLLLKHSGNLKRLSAFQDGLFYVQDAAARMAVIASGVKVGDTVLDACAAPGGKSFAAAIQMLGKGKILSCDIYEKKLNIIQNNARRLGISCIQTAVADARVRQQETEDFFDVVLADVPCSGLGVIRRKPDIRYKNLQGTEGLPALQLEILSNLAYSVKPGGVLLYSTCTVLHRENEAIVSSFLHTHRNFQMESFDLPQSGLSPGQITLWPHINGTDGFFIAKLRRTYE